MAKRFSISGWLVVVSVGLFVAYSCYMQQLVQLLNTADLQLPALVVDPVALADKADQADMAMVTVRLPPPPLAVAKSPAKEPQQGSTAPLSKVEARLEPKADQKADQNVTPKAEQPSIEQPSQPTQPKAAQALAGTVSATPNPSMAAAKPITKNGPIASPVINTTLHGSEGEALLQDLDAGNGPVIEIAWPVSFAQRQQLFGVLVNCLGVQLAVMVGDTVHVIGDHDRAGQYQPTRYSSLVRLVSGVMVPDERAIYQSSRYFSQGQAIRLFPRLLDGRLLAGLKRLAQQPMAQIQQIHGNYRIGSGRLLVENIRINGQRVAGQLLLSDGQCAI